MRLSILREREGPKMNPISKSSRIPPPQHSVFHAKSAPPIKEQQSLFDGQSPHPTILEPQVHRYVVKDILSELPNIHKTLPQSIRHFTFTVLNNVERIVKRCIVAEQQEDEKRHAEITRVGDAKSAQKKSTDRVHYWADESAPSRNRK